MEKLLLLFVQKYSRPSFLISCIHIPYYVTLAAQVFRWQKKYPLLILRSRPSRDSQEPKTKKKINSDEGFLRKSPFCTFSCINPGFGGPWDMFWIFFLIDIFILLQKNTFGQKSSNCMYGFKSTILEKLPKWDF